MQIYAARCNTYTQWSTLGATPLGAVRVRIIGTLLRFGIVGATIAQPRGVLVIWRCWGLEDGITYKDVVSLYTVSNRSVVKRFYNLT